MGKRGQYLFWQELGLEGHLRPRDCPFASPLAFSICLGFSFPHHRQGNLPILAFHLGIWAWASSELVHGLPPPASAHDREGISSEALTGNCPLVPRQRVAAGRLFSSFISLIWDKVLRTKNPNQKEVRSRSTLVHDANPGKA